MTGDADAAPVEMQLEAIARLDQALDEQQIPYWVFGGWAVDFWVGRVTRPHGDIDVVAWRADYDRVLDALTAEGFEHTPVQDEVVGTRYRWRRAEVEFTFVETTDGADVVIPIPGQPIRWSSEPLGVVHKELGGVACRTIPLQLLVAGKSPSGASERTEKDQADLAALSELSERE